MESYSYMLHVIVAPKNFRRLFQITFLTINLHANHFSSHRKVLARENITQQTPGWWDDRNSAQAMEEEHVRAHAQTQEPVQRGSDAEETLAESNQERRSGDAQTVVQWETETYPALSPCYWWGAIFLC